MTVTFSTQFSDYAFCDDLILFTFSGLIALDLSGNITVGKVENVYISYSLKYSHVHS